MLKKLINDDRSEEWNILMFMLLFLALFFIIFTPIVFIGIMMQPELSSILTETPDTATEKIADTIGSITSFLEFFILGTIAELSRRKKSQNFKLTDERATKLLFYFVISMTSHIVLSFVGGFIS